LKDEYKKLGVTLSPPFAFENEWAVWVRSEDANNWRVRFLSELASYSRRHKVRAGWPPDFINDPKGGAAKLIGFYGLRFSPPEPLLIIDVSEIYNLLAEKRVDVIVGNSTDGEAIEGWLTKLKDDRQFFPPYEPILLVRDASVREHSELQMLLAQLPAAISLDELRRLNLQVKHSSSANRFEVIHNIARNWLAAHGM
jgi:glycine betaine/choline ABC-type transport system substrate-binding protein